MLFEKVYSWGNGGNGRLGLGDIVDRAEATLVTRFVPVSNAERLADRASASIELLTTIVSIECGACHSLALSKEGNMYIWGKNSQGQCGLGHQDDTLRPTLVTSLLAEVAISSFLSTFRSH